MMNRKERRVKKLLHFKRLKAQAEAKKGPEFKPEYSNLFDEVYAKFAPAKSTGLIGGYYV